MAGENYIGYSHFDNNRINKNESGGGEFAVEFNYCKPGDDKCGIIDKLSTTSVFGVPGAYLVYYAGQYHFEELQYIWPYGVLAISVFIIFVK